MLAGDGAQAGATLQRPPSGVRLDLSRAHTESSEGSALPPAGLPEDDPPWQDQDITGLTLDTLHLLSQWLLLVPAACRQAHLPAHAYALQCCLETLGAAELLSLHAHPAFKGLVLAAEPRTTWLSSMHCRQEAFQELGQHLMRALTTPLPEVIRLSERDDVMAHTVSMG